jgi:biopolymer transport protein ExbD
VRRRARLSVDTPEINLVPLLDMVSLLIQMLLVSAQFGAFAEVDSQVAGPGTPEDAVRLGLEVRVVEEGFDVGWTEDGERKSRMLRCAHVPCVFWDGISLSHVAQELKAKFPDERQAIVAPDPGVPFDGVVTAMDALRSVGQRPLFPDLVVSP